MSVISGQDTVEYNYNDRGDLIRTLKGDGTSNEIDYNENGFISSIREYDSENELVFQYDYDISWNGRVDTKVTPQNFSNSIMHDLDGNIVSNIDNGGLPELSQELPYGRRVLLGDEVSHIDNICCCCFQYTIKIFALLIFQYK